MIIRWILAMVIGAVDLVFKPRMKQWPPQKKELIDKATENLALYQFPSCPFCVKVRWAFRSMGADIELRNAKGDEKFKNELTSQGGKYKAPCLRIGHQDQGDQWLYESSDIIEYVRQKLTPILEA